MSLATAAVDTKKRISRSPEKAQPAYSGSADDTPNIVLPSQARIIIENLLFLSGHLGHLGQNSAKHKYLSTQTIVCPISHNVSPLLKKIRPLICIDELRPR